MGNRQADYRLLTTRAAIVKEQVIFEVQIPLVQGEDYQIFNVIPVPTKYHNGYAYLEPQSQYVLVSSTRVWYQPISAVKLSECKRWEEGTVICQLEGPMYKIASTEEHCEMALLSHVKEPPSKCRVRTALPSVFIHPLRGNRWVMVLPHELVFDLICQLQVQTVTLNGSGILALKPGCSLRGSSIVIRAKTTYETNIYADVVPRFNLTQKTEERAVVLHTGGLDVEVSELQQAVNKLKEEEPWTQLDYHHLGNYTVTGSALVLVVVLLLLMCRLWQRQRSSQRERQTSRPQPAERRTRDHRQENLI